MFFFHCNSSFAQYVEADTSEIPEPQYPLIKNDFDLVRKISQDGNKGIIYTKSTGEIQVNKPQRKEKVVSFDGKEVE